ncbi:luciferin sulfotransferase [Tribolium castaneum]|uniref:Sulfotransferase family cytosolic 1B member 1-like Protein n=1 Tax=Tribolium castaneum TaxID=7070 RepID=D6WKX9_TRICA|nr:PREDICTED: sulfotransferase family cytosolic 1B member 1 [Tribolium castaneum]EFA03546.1 Sulfotransferase family cytosolic 1B member 1-like Protein [Tribolium castaneum]|eukprot:XP_968893.1 PREDICTED: sulfotransferase family cytosolic 1B member 1 [Tribolium castaneum]
MDVKTAPTEEELNKLLKKTFTSNLRPNYITVQGFVLPERYREFEKILKEYEVFDTDVWICGFPKTGTTWISEIAWLIANDLDYEGAKADDYRRTRMLEFSMLFSETFLGGEPYELDSVGFSKDQKHPRSIKSHLPFPLLPEQILNGTKKPRIICTARNPMDTCVSYYHQCANYEGFTGTFEEFCKLFLFDKINYGPYWKHVLSFWEHRSKSNILFLTYEEMKKDLPGVLQKVAKLLGKTLSKEDSVRLQQHVSFDSMKKNPAVNKESINNFLVSSGTEVKAPFIRAGKVGGYKNSMSPELIAQFRYWMQKRFEGTGLNLLEE